MDASLWVAKTGLTAQQTRMTVISNNLANVNTTGFKRDRPVFEDLLYQNIRQAGGQILKKLLELNRNYSMMAGVVVKLTEGTSIKLKDKLIRVQKENL